VKVKHKITSHYTCITVQMIKFDRGLFAEGRGLWRGLMCRSRYSVLERVAC